MKNILCFGDSNTFGYIPNSGKRYDKEIRWTGLLGKLLGDNYHVIEAGCNNRTCFTDNPDGQIQTGYLAIKRYFSKNIDMVVLNIGVNDLQFFYNNSLEDVKFGIKEFIENVQINIKSKILLVAPPILSEDVLKGNFAVQFDKSSIEKSKYLPEIYKNIAKETKCLFVDYNNQVALSPLDGLHYEPEQHKQIAEILTIVISESF